MRLISLELESKVRNSGLWPETRVAWASIYVVALDLLLFAVQVATRRIRPGISASLGGWIIFLSAVAIVLLVILGFRWMRSHMLWRLRNRLIVTYIFIGVIPVFLLLVISLTSLYLFARQFAGFVVTSDIATHLHSMEASNHAISRSLINQFERAGKSDASLVAPIRPRRPEWTHREVCVWYRDQSQPNCVGPEGASPFAFPSFVTGDFADIVRDRGGLYLRVATVTAEPASLRVVTSEPISKNLIGEIAGDLGQVTFSPDTQNSNTANAAPFSAGRIPPASGATDLQIVFPVPIQVVDSGHRRAPTRRRFGPC